MNFCTILFSLEKNGLYANGLIYNWNYLGIFVALLRGINVSGHHNMKMVDLKALLNGIGLLEVKTYLQSGNVIFKSDLDQISDLESIISKAINKEFGYDIKVKVIEKKVFQRIVLINPFLNNSEIDTKQLYYIHLMGQPDQNAYSDMKNDTRYPEKMKIIEETLYVHYLQGYGRSKLHGSIIEKKLKIDATARNHNTMKNLGEILDTMN